MKAMQDKENASKCKKIEFKLDNFKNIMWKKQQGVDSTKVVET